MSEEETKPDIDTINLKVATQDGNEIFFKVCLEGPGLRSARCTQTS
jgi:hypothetical protein